MSEKFAVGRTSKPSSVHSEIAKQSALDEYRAEQEATLELMAVQRAHRLNALKLVQMKNRGG